MFFLIRVAKNCTLFLLKHASTTTEKKKKQKQSSLIVYFGFFCMIIWQQAKRGQHGAIWNRMLNWRCLSSSDHGCSSQIVRLSKIAVVRQRLSLDTLLFRRHYSELRVYLLLENLRREMYACNVHALLLTPLIKTNEIENNAAYIAKHTKRYILNALFHIKQLLNVYL